YEALAAHPGRRVHRRHPVGAPRRARRVQTGRAVANDATRVCRRPPSVGAGLAGLATMTPRASAAGHPRSAPASRTSLQRRETVTGRIEVRTFAALVLGAWLAALLAPVATGAQDGPIRIGMLAPLTGPFAQVGKDMLNGAEQYLDEIGRVAAGRPLELIVEDSEGNPSTALNKARKLVEQDKVHVLTGGLLANVGYALQ